MSEEHATKNLNDGMWQFAQIWNESLERLEEREYEPRDYMWASELGKLYGDVYLKMKGVKPTNPPNPRSMRKFEAGNLWEWLVKIILLRAGILIEEQRRIKVAYPDMIAVSGKLDFYAGGTVDIEKANAAVDSLYLPERTQEAMKRIVEHLAKNYPDGLDKKALEIKSVSSHMMNALEITQQPLAIHALQAYHYTKDEEINRADVVYICRDDCRMMEFPILADSEKYETMYVEYVKQMTEYYRTDTEPPKAEPIIFDEASGKFSINRQVGWSPYLTLVYGLEDQAAFDEKYKGIPARWNRVVKRVVMGDKMTAKNLEALEEIKQAGFDIEEIKTRFNTGEDSTEETSE